LVRDVGAPHEDLGAERRELADLTDLAAHPVLVAVGSLPRVPLLLRDQARAPGEHEPGPDGAGEVLGDGEADAAQTADDEVDASLPEHGPARSGGGAGHRLEPCDPAVTAPERNDALVAQGGELGQDPLSGPRFALGGVSGDIDDRGRDVGQLLTESM